MSAQHGVFYFMTHPDGGEPVLELQAGYGYEERKRLSTSFRLGDGLVGQCAKEKKRILLTEVPDDYVRINSGLGSAAPLNIIVLPVLFEGTVRAVVELASFSAFSPAHQSFLDQITESIGLVMNTIEADTRTENLLRQSQSLAEELRASNEDLGRQARLLADQNLEAERKNQEVERSKQKAGQLAVSSRYKSEFIANMSHELRTPLNSLLILAEQLEDNVDNNMTATQVEYASVIRSSGKELLALVNGILDLANVESGTVTVEVTEVSVAQLCSNLQREFDPLAADKGLLYTVDLADEAPMHIDTDSQLLRQILKNLLSNAFKFTEHGSVTVRAEPSSGGWSPGATSLVQAPSVLALRVTDTGIGIDDEQRDRIFEAFAQGDGTTARLYGGTGLGLSISRELVSLLGGDISVSSVLGEGSTFTVYLPVQAARMHGVGQHPAQLPAATGSAAPVAPPFQPVRSGHRAADDWTGQRRPTLAESGSIAGTTILLVDDDFRNLFAMSALLERSRAEVICVENGVDALAALERTPEVDIVLMDIMMPIMDGYATIRAVRAQPRFASLPIIAVTGKVVPGERQRCLDAGANDYIPKPVDTAELLTAMAPWMPTLPRSA